jgi:hypothetical protein
MGLDLITFPFFLELNSSFAGFNDYHPIIDCY